MLRPSPPHVLRARQRGRTILAALERHLRPQLHQVGIDRAKLKLVGSVIAIEGGPAALRDYGDALATHDEYRDGTFQRPSNLGGKIELRTRSSPDLTISGTISFAPRNRVNLRADLEINPTRTLAHLLAQYPDDELMAVLTGHDERRFLQRASVDQLRAALDGNDNWIADYDRAYALLGPDIFGAFIPAYVRNIRSWVQTILDPLSGGQTAWREVGEETHCRSERIEVRLNWGAATLPQIEAYFERFHSRAPEAARRFALSALNGPNLATARSYRESLTAHRVGNTLATTLPVSGNRNVLVYAKQHDRLRFEVKQSGTDRPRGAADSVDSRLVGRLELARHVALSAADWPAVSELFDEPAVPTVGDLVDAIVEIVRTCRAQREQLLRPALERMLGDGGIMDEGFASEFAPIIRRLVSRGIIEPIGVRTRDRSRLETRYRLREPYRTAQERATGAIRSLTDPVTAVEGGET